MAVEVHDQPRLSRRAFLRAAAGAVGALAAPPL
ncbi:MAG: twin-arginine translocation signal domain-containing protein, partial [Roseiflexaceae bacterium]|nr:twin-arginine translocation signal domain-containing protein [Roseiflexaceae bacterium]